MNHNYELILGILKEYLEGTTGDIENGVLEDIADAISEAVS